MSTEGHAITRGSEGEGGRRQAPAGEARPRGRGLAARAPRIPHRSLRYAECGEPRPPSLLVTTDEVALGLAVGTRHGVWGSVAPAVAVVEQGSTAGRLDEGRDR
jgi:hypothetical protein